MPQVTLTSIIRSGLILLSGILLSQSAYAIFGGHDVEATDPIARSAVAVIMPDAPPCSGSLIAQNLVLTAAHCVHGQKLEVVFGRSINDVGARTGAGILRETVTSILDLQFSGAEMSVDQRQGSGACFSDSGGPALIETIRGYQIVGVTHGGPACNDYGIYTKAYDYADWIDEAIKRFRLSDVLRGGRAIPVAEVRKAIATAQISTAREWCTPAVQVGPRTFITAAHCTVLLEGQERLHVRGPNLSLEPKFKVISTPGISDESSFSAPNCKAIFDSLRDGDILTREQMLDCWANNGQADLALLVTDQDVPGPMLSIASAPITLGETLKFLGYAPSCGGDAGYYRTTAFNVFGFNHMQVVLDGMGTGVPSGNSWACGGDSGGIYYRDSAQAGTEVAAILTASTQPEHENVMLNINGKKVILPPHLSGGTNLTDPQVWNWLEQNAKSNQLEICGINARCSEISLPGR